MIGGERRRGEVERREIEAGETGPKARRVEVKTVCKACLLRCVDHK